MGTLGLFVLCAILLLTGNGAPVEKRRESTKEILELESLLKKSAGEDKQVFPSQLQKEAKAKEAKLAAESDAREKDNGVDIPLVPPEMQVDGLAEKDELEAQLKQQEAAANAELQKEETESTDENDSEEHTEETNEEDTEDTEEEPEMMDEVEKREQELFMKYLKESPELWQQLMDSLEYGNDDNDLDWQQGRYANPDDEYPALMQEWRAAADNRNVQNYIPQQYYPDGSDVAETAEGNFGPELSQGEEEEEEEEEELENELPQIPREFNNLEELQEYYSDKLAEEGSKKLGYERPEWADASENDDNIANELEDVEAGDKHTAQKRASVNDQLIM